MREIVIMNYHFGKEFPTEGLNLICVVLERISFFIQIRSKALELVAARIHLGTVSVAANLARR